MLEGVMLYFTAHATLIEGDSVVKGLAAMHVAVVLVCAMFGFVWHRAVTKVLLDWSDSFCSHRCVEVD